MVTAMHNVPEYSLILNPINSNPLKLVQSQGLQPIKKKWTQGKIQCKKFKYIRNPS